MLYSISEELKQSRLHSGCPENVTLKRFGDMKEDRFCIAEVAVTSYSEASAMKIQPLDGLVGPGLD